MIIPSFSVAQLQSDFSIMRITDTSTGTLGTIVKRRVIITNSSNVILLPPYVEWDINDATIDISCLSTDLALTIQVQWLDVTNAVVNEVTNVYVFDARNKSFFYYLSQLQTGLPPIVQNTNYFNSSAVLYTNVMAAQYAILFAGDTVAAQSCLNRSTLLSQNQNKYF